MSKPLRFEDVCPHCGSHLMMREGAYGDFLACPRFPACKYTKSLPEEEDLSIWEPPKPYCPKCHHTGLIPFRNKKGEIPYFKSKKGKIIPITSVYCECCQNEKEIYHYEPIHLEDFDFPCSYDWRAYYEEQWTGKSLPPIDLPEMGQPQVVEHIV